MEYWSDGFSRTNFEILNYGWKGDYIFDVMPVIAVIIGNKPGTLAEMADKFGKEGINTNYVYGSAIPSEEKSLFILSPEDIEEAAKLFPDS